MATMVETPPKAEPQRCLSCKRNTGHETVTASGIAGALRCKVCGRKTIPAAAWRAATR